MHSQQFHISPNVRASNPDETTGTVVVACNHKYYRLNGVARDIMVALAGSPKSLPDLHAVMSVDCSPDEIARVASALCDRQFIFPGDTPPAIKASGAPPKASYPRSYLQLRMSLIPARFVAALARPVSLIMKPRVVAFCLPLAIFLQVWFASAFAHNVLSGFNDLTYSTFTVVVIVNYLCLLLHECGHAAASLKMGTQPGPIGVGLYLIYPVLYTDVGETWMLPAKRRLLVDCGGLYITGLLALIGIPVYLFYPTTVIGVIDYLLAVTTIANLNPFIRMDGYWIVSDLFAIDNLMERTRATARWLGGFLLGKRALMPDLGLGGGLMRASYMIYLAGTVAFSIYLVIAITSELLPVSIHGIVTLTCAVTATLHRGTFSALHLTVISTCMKEVFPLVIIGFPVFMFCYRKSRERIRRLQRG